MQNANIKLIISNIEILVFEQLAEGARLAAEAWERFLSVTRTGTQLVPTQMIHPSFIFRS